MPSPEFLEIVRSIEAQLRRLSELADVAPATNPVLSSRQLAPRLGVTPQALASWARHNGAGAVREGWLVLGRNGTGKRAAWRWQRLVD